MSSRNKWVTLAVLAVGFVGCAHADETDLPSGEEPTGRLAQPVTQADCDGMTPFPGCKDGPGPINRTTCNQNWWPSSQPGARTVCFGRTCDINTENNRRRQCGIPECHYLAMPNTGSGRWTECKNELFIECSLRGLLPGIGNSIIVSPPGGVPPTSWAGNEYCYVWKKYHFWPKYTPNAVPTQTVPQALHVTTATTADPVDASVCTDDALPTETTGDAVQPLDYSDDPGTWTDFGTDAAPTCSVVE